MPDISEKEVVILPEYDENGRAYFTLPNAEVEKNLVVTCPKVAEKVIPVIFLPGVMGSNLKDTKQGKSVWHGDMFQGIDTLPWTVKTPQERKQLLDPETTEVDQRGKVLYNDQEGKLFPSRKDRGWGSALYMSYGEPLHVLQFMLNDEHILLDNLLNNTHRLTKRQELIGENLGAEKGEVELTESDVKKSYDFLFPLHVFGYNWLQSNAESAKHLAEYIKQVLDIYQGRLACNNKVILITHSMGGLVARHYSENMGGKERILGIVHGVMPDLGSPTAYRRMKTGERGIVGNVIGPDAANMMPVLAQSPGPLQLLPGTAYGMGWLKIYSKIGRESKPETDPYKEIYLNKSNWWQLCEKELLLGDVDMEWANYALRIQNDIKVFIEGLNGKYHPNSFAFYGSSKSNPSDGYLIWQEREAPRPIFGLPVESPLFRHSDGCTFELTSSNSAGDGTVPVRSGRIDSPVIQSLLATDVDHEGAYRVKPLNGNGEISQALLFTLRAVIKIAQQAVE